MFIRNLETRFPQTCSPEACAYKLDEEMDDAASADHLGDGGRVRGRGDVDVEL